jgi:mono/diheme cytochrome c family protein
MNMLIRTLAVIVTLGLAGQASAVDFAKEIRPIFAESCYKCHGPKKVKGKLRLDSKAEILKTDTVIVAGKPDESELLKRISLPHDHDDLMPPVDEGEPLKPEQIELIKKWIAEGAAFGDWTADAAAEGPKEEKLPEVKAAPQDALSRLHEANALAMPLANNTNLLNVDFRADAANVGDAQLAMLRPVSEQIAWLGLAGTQVTDAGLAQIKDLKNLRRLHLEKTGITDAGLVHLKGLTELRYLNLYGTKVTDAGLEHLKGLKNLQKLYLWQTEVTDAGEKAFKEAMPNVDINRGWVAPPAPPAAETAAAPTADPAFEKFTALAANFTAESCCDKANKDKKVCEHPCCKEALAAEKVCEKCNPK